MYHHILLTPLPRDRFQLLKSLRYKDVCVPKGYCTNGADTPRWAWSFFPPNKTDYLPAVIVHDYLCSINQYDKADRYLKEILELLGVGKVSIFILYCGVRFYSLFVRGKIGVKFEN